MTHLEWTSDVRQEEWSLEMIFRWLEETAAFLYQIQLANRVSRASDPDRLEGGN